MAQTRLERIGTIYTRTRGLLQSGAVKWLDRPLWYDIYEAFPPKEEPRFDRETPKIPLKQIFYNEDKVRAEFHKNNKSVGTVNLQNRKAKSLTQRFIDNYEMLEMRYAGSAPQEQVYAEAVDLLRKEREYKKEQDEDVSLTSSFREAQRIMSEEKTSVNIKDIFKS